MFFGPVALFCCPFALCLISDKNIGIVGPVRDFFCLLFFSRVLYCAFFHEVVYYLEKKVNKGQCVLIQYDTCGKKLYLDAYAYLKPEPVENGVPLSFFPLQFLHQFHENVQSIAKDSGERTADEFFSDDQRQYIGRRCRGADAVPYHNRSLEPETLCVVFSEDFFFGRFFRKHQQIKVVICESSDSHQTVIYDELFPTMKMVLSSSQFTYGYHVFKAPYWLNVVVGVAIIYGIYYVSHNFSREEVMRYPPVLYFQKIENSAAMDKIKTGFQIFPDFFKCVTGMTLFCYKKAESFYRELITFPLFKEFLVELPLRIFRYARTHFNKFVVNITSQFKTWQNQITQTDRVKTFKTYCCFVGKSIVGAFKDDPLQDLYTHQLEKSRSEFIRLFLDAAQQTDFEKVKNDTYNTLDVFKKQNLKDEDWLTKLEEFWCSWSASTPFLNRPYLTYLSADKTMNEVRSNSAATRTSHAAQPKQSTHGISALSYLLPSPARLCTSHCCFAVCCQVSRDEEANGLCHHDFDRVFEFYCVEIFMPSYLQRSESFNFVVCAARLDVHPWVF